MRHRRRRQQRVRAMREVARLREEGLERMQEMVSREAAATAGEEARVDEEAPSSSAADAPQRAR